LLSSYSKIFRGLFMDNKTTLRTLTYHRGAICVRDTLEPVFLQINSKHIEGVEYLLLKCKKDNTKLAIMVDDEVTIYDRETAITLWKKIGG
jgi:hypothetical protein